MYICPRFELSTRILNLSLNMRSILGFYLFLKNYRSDLTHSKSRGIPKAWVFLWDPIHKSHTCLFGVNAGIIYSIFENRFRQNTFFMQTSFLFIYIYISIYIYLFLLFLFLPLSISHDSEFGGRDAKEA